MGIHPTKPRYTCANCLYGDKPREVPCTVCPVPDKPTEMPRKWEPISEFANAATSLTRGTDATVAQFDNKDEQGLVCKVETPKRARHTRLF